MVLLQYDARLLLFGIIAVSMTAFVLSQVTPALAQTTPSTQNLEKRNYYSLDDQHLTARYGNTKVCGDHMCGPGEWARLQNNLNQAQITHHGNATKFNMVPPKPIPQPSAPVNSTATTTTPQPVPPTPTPPTAVSSSVCMAVKMAVGNSTTSDVVAKVMADLGCK